MSYLKQGDFLRLLDSDRQLRVYKVVELDIDHKEVKLSSNWNIMSHKYDPGQWYTFDQFETAEEHKQELIDNGYNIIDTDKLD